jgi:ATP-dependent Clp protease adapter protein ClpS
MSEQANQQNVGEQGGASTPVKPRLRRQPAKTPPKVLPPWKVILHNDDVNERNEVIRIVRQLTPLSKQEAEIRVIEADQSGAALLLMTHQERAELYVEQFTSMGLTTTCEPDA